MRGKVKPGHDSSKTAWIYLSLKMQRTSHLLPSPGRNQWLSEVSNCDLESQFLQLNQSPVWDCKMDPARGSAAIDKSAKGEPESAS